MATDIISTQPYKGSRDFYPKDMAVRRWIFDRLRDCLTRFGYQEYDGPMLEPLELYSAKTSEEIVNEQLYWLTDRGGRKLAIRPEMTPTLARMVAQKQNELAFPLRWFSIPNLWRFERPQRGRLREHWQLNVDTFGGSELAEDTEICLLIHALMAEFGAKDGYEVRLNHRALTNFLFQDFLKINLDKLQTISRLVDAASKMGQDKYKEALENEKLDNSQIQFLTELSQGPSISAIEKVASKEPSFQHLFMLLKRLEDLSIGSVFRFDPSIMRGFQYYTGMVVEVYDLHPENNRALFGGGRYDNLVSAYGGKPLSGVGFGLGDVTLKHFLETHQLLPDLTKDLAGIYVAYLEPQQELVAQKLAFQLRELLSKAKNISPVFSALNPEKPKKIFLTAERHQARAVIFVGPDDVKAARFPLKDLKTKSQVLGSVTELVDAILQFQ